MTGFGSATGTVGRVRVDVEVRTVNHRFFNPSLKLPAAFGAWEAEVREALRQRIARGHVTVFVRVQRDTADAGGAVIDEARFAAYLERLRALANRHNLAGDIDVGTVLRMPDVIVGASNEGEEIGGTAAELVRLVESAVDGLTAMRVGEGARLATFLRERIDLVDGAVGRIAVRAPERVVEQRDRLREAVRVLTDGVAADPQRIAQEIAILADRLDVSEELDRFRSHIAAFRATLDGEKGDGGGGVRGGGGDEGIGKKLGFITQELLREANTTGSKANDAPIMHEVVLIKEELERIREQVDNLE
jgi:uncharacterized protein (TIGR00255 family)